MWRPFLDPSKRNVWVCWKLLKYGNFEWQICQRTRIETWFPKDQLYLNWFFAYRTSILKRTHDVIHSAWKVQQKTIEECGSSDDCESDLNRFVYTSSRGNKREITARNLWLLPFVRRQWTSCRSIVSQHICSDVCTELNGAVADANPDFTLRRRGCYRDVISSVVAPSRAKYGNALTDGDNRPSARPGEIQ